MTPRWSLNALKMLPRCPQDAPKRLPRCPYCLSQLHSCILVFMCVSSLFLASVYRGPSRPTGPALRKDELEFNLSFVLNYCLAENAVIYNVLLLWSNEKARFAL